MEHASVIGERRIDPGSLAQTPLPRRLAVLEGGQRRVYVDGRPAAGTQPVDLTLVVDATDGEAGPAARLWTMDAGPAQAPRLPVHDAFDLFMPEHEPPPFATADQIARAWFLGCQDTAPGATSLQMACDLLPDAARDERRVLRGAAARARVLQNGPAAGVAPTAALTGPLHATDWRTRDPHAVLDDCLVFLQQTSSSPFEERPGQSQMAHAVLDVLLDRGTLTVEAGTGTGKTLAYALPAVLVAARHERRVVLSTHTRNLQQQLTTRDLPWLWEHLGLDRVDRGGDRSGLRFAKLLGRTNYVCRHALLAWLEEQRSRGGARMAAQVVLALLRSPDGTLEDVLPGLPPAVWAAIHSRRGACVGRRCRGESPCPVYRVRDAARSADVLVVNHALLLADARGGGGILGEWEALVIDEAHHLPRVATEALGHRLGARPLEALGHPLGQLEREARALQPVPGGERWSRRALDWCDAQRRLQRSLTAWWRRLDAELPQRARTPARQRYLDGAEVFGCLGEETEALQDDLQSCLRQGLQQVSTLQDAVLDWAPGSELLELWSVSIDLLQEVVTAFVFLVRGDDDEWAFFLDFSGDASALQEIVALPLDVAEDLPELLHYDDAAVVFTSATLYVDDDSSWFRAQVGTGSESSTLQVPSPFDHEKQCLLVQTANLGEWRDVDFVPQVADLVASLQQSTRRRTLVLLTSRHSLHALEEQLRERLADDVTLLAQSAADSRSLLAARFATTPGAILLGLASFWEGVDFPGQALELLVIPKLPFLVPNEPLVEARCQRLRSRGEDAFGEFLLPEAILRLRQGFGRLLRSPRDRGAVILLDARLETRAYGAEFLRPLPLASRVFEDADALVQVVATWCADGTEPAGAREPVQVDFLPEES